MDLFPSAIDLFHDGAFVRLRSRARGKYLHADEDAVHVSLRPLGDVPSLNAVWKAQLWAVQAQGGHVLLLLQGAAYGRYLGAAHEDEVPPSGHRGVRALQFNYNLPHLDPPCTWAAARVEVGEDYVRLHNGNGQGCLRANGRHRYWNNLVTVDAWNGDETTMVQWMVEAIPPTPEALPLPPPPPPQPPVHVRRGLFRRRTGHNMHQQQHPGRTIRYVRADADGNFDDEDWPEFVFDDNSVANLRTHMANLENDENITLGVRAGMNARVIPLVTNLPNNEDPIQIIVYTTGSPAPGRLRYPNFDQPEA